MWDRPQFLGQVSIAPGTGFEGPFGIYSPPAGVYNAPSGAPLYSPEIVSPDNAEEELHCYKCPDGSTRMLTLSQARGSGCEARPLSECGAGAPQYAAGPPAGLMGRRRYMGADAGGAQGSPQGGGQGGAQGNPSPASQPAATQTFDTGPFFFPTLPLVAPGLYPPAPPPGTTCSWEKDVNGNNVYVCRQAEGVMVPTTPVVSYGPVVYPARSLFSVY